MSRTRRIYNRKPWLFFPQWLGGTRKYFRTIVKGDDLYMRYYHSLCMGHCKMCWYGYFGHDLKHKRRDLLVEVQQRIKVRI